MPVCLGLRSPQRPSASPWTPLDLRPTAGAHQVLGGGTGAGPRGARDSLVVPALPVWTVRRPPPGEQLTLFLPRQGFGPQCVPASCPS